MAGSEEEWASGSEEEEEEPSSSEDLPSSASGAQEEGQEEHSSSENEAEASARGQQGQQEAAEEDADDEDAEQLERRRQANVRALLSGRCASVRGWGAAWPAWERHTDKMQAPQSCLAADAAPGRSLADQGEGSGACLGCRLGQPGLQPQRQPPPPAPPTPAPCSLTLTRKPLLPRLLSVQDAEAILRRPFQSPHPSAGAGPSEVGADGRAWGGW